MDKNGLEEFQICTGKIKPKYHAHKVIRNIRVTVEKGVVSLKEGESTSQESSLLLVHSVLLVGWDRLVHFQGLRRMD